MQYSVPQFIDVEDKIIGPLTISQFLYILGAAGTLFALWSIAPSIEVFLIPAIPILGLFLALAFYKVNGRSFSTFLKAMLAYLIHHKVLIWRREYMLADVKTDVMEEKSGDQKTDEPKIGQKITRSRLRKLSSVLDNEGGVDQSVYGISDSAELDATEEANERSRDERESRVKEILGKV